MRRADDGETVFSARERLVLLLLVFPLAGLIWLGKTVLGTDPHGWRLALLLVLWLPFTGAILLCVAGALFGRISFYDD